MRDAVRRALAAHQPQLLPLEGRMPAAVMLLLYEHDGEEHVLFQVRTHLVEHHKGEVSLPGGARDEGDDSLLTTALRETHEEIGVALDHIEVLGQLDDTPTRAGFLMSAFVGAMTGPSPYPFRYAASEVASLLEVPLAHLVEGAMEWMQYPNGDVARAYRFGDDIIWGATGRVVSQFLDLLRAELGMPPLDPDGVPGPPMRC